MSINYEAYDKNKSLSRNKSNDDFKYNVLQKSAQKIMMKKNNSTFYRNSNSINDSIQPNKRLNTIENEPVNSKYNSKYFNVTNNFNSNNNFNNEKQQRNTRYNSAGRNNQYNDSIVQNKKLEEITNKPIKNKFQNSNDQIRSQIKQINLDEFLKIRKQQNPEHYNDNYINFIKNYYNLAKKENKNFFFDLTIDNNINTINNQSKNNNKQYNIFKRSNKANNNQFNNQSSNGFNDQFNMNQINDQFNNPFNNQLKNQNMNQFNNQNMNQFINPFNNHLKNQNMNQFNNQNMKQFNLNQQNRNIGESNGHYNLLINNPNYFLNLNKNN